MQKTSQLMDQAYQLLKAKGIMRPRDLKAADIPESYLWEMASTGRIQHLGRGLYALNELELSSFHSLVEVAQYVPKGVICLLSALQYHELTTQLPPAVWLAIPAHAHRPHIPHQSLELVQSKPELMTLGVETHIIEDTPVQIFSSARTIADCFKFRGRVGMDVALEALKMGLGKGVKANEIWIYCKPLRVTKVILPYLEALA
jgi:predicted transcriptional regulator of viral defense system